MAEHTITLKNESGGSSKASPVAGGGDRESGTTAVGKVSKGKIAVASIVAVKGYIEPFVDRAASYQINTVQLRTGASEHQARLQEAYSTGKKVANAALNVATGVMVGGAWGAAAAIVYSGATSVIDLGQKQSQIQLSSRLEGISNRLANVRAGGSPSSASGSR